MSDNTTLANIKDKMSTAFKKVQISADLDPVFAGANEKMKAYYHHAQEMVSELEMQADVLEAQYHDWRENGMPEDKARLVAEWVTGKVSRFTERPARVVGAVTGGTVYYVGGYVAGGVAGGVYGAVRTRNGLGATIGAVVGAGYGSATMAPVGARIGGVYAQVVHDAYMEQFEDYLVQRLIRGNKDTPQLATQIKNNVIVENDKHYLALGNKAVGTKVGIDNAVCSLTDYATGKIFELDSATAKMTVRNNTGKVIAAGAYSVDKQDDSLVEHLEELVRNRNSSSEIRAINVNDYKELNNYRFNEEDNVGYSLHSGVMLQVDKNAGVKEIVGTRACGQ